MQSLKDSLNYVLYCHVQETDPSTFLSCPIKILMYLASQVGGKDRKKKRTPSLLTFTVLPGCLPPADRRNSSLAGEVKLSDVFRSPTVPDPFSSLTCELVKPQPACPHILFLVSALSGQERRVDSMLESPKTQQAAASHP